MHYLTTSEAGRLFPVPISSQSVLRKIRNGHRGVKLSAHFDGYRYLVTRDDIDRFVRSVSEVRKSLKVPSDPDADFELFQALRPTSKNSVR